MTNEQLANLGRYAAYALFGALIAAGLKLGQELAGTSDIEWRAIASVLILSFCGALGTAAGTSTLTRPGSEGIRAQVDALRAQGVHRSDMVVLGPDDAVATIAGNGQAGATFTPTQVSQVADELELRMRAAPAPQPDSTLPPIPRYGAAPDALVSKPPQWLPLGDEQRDAPPAGGRG